MILKGRGFRGGSDEKIMRMWFGLEIDVVGLPPLVIVLSEIETFVWCIVHPECLISIFNEGTLS